MNRRDFIKTGTGAFFIAAAGRALGQGAPSNRIRLCVVGCARTAYSETAKRFVVDPKGFRGRGFQVMQAAMEVSGCEIAALCDVDATALDYAASEVKRVKGNEPRKFRDLREALKDPDIDGVIVATPDHWHVLAGIWTMKAGKALYLEKPIGITAGEAETLAAVQKQTGVIFQLGTQRRSSYATQQGMAQIKSGKYGSPRWAKAWCLSDRPAIKAPGAMRTPDFIDWDMWQGPTPHVKGFRGELVHYNWRFFRGYGTGDLPNNGLHFVDIARWALGAGFPSSVYAGGGKLFYPGEDFEYEDTHMLNVKFPTGQFLTWEGCSHSRGKPFMNQSTGCLVYCDDGLVNFDAGGGCMVFDRTGRKQLHAWKANELDPEQQKNGINAGAGLRVTDFAHAKKFVECVRAKDPATAMPIDEAVKSNLLTELGNVSLLTDEVVKVDPATGRLADPNSAAAKFWTKAYEPGWEVKA